MILKKIVRFIVGIALLFYLFSLLDFTILLQTIGKIDPLTYSLAILACLVGNLLCALRWRNLSNSTILNLPKKKYILIYFESIAANCVLPGGILGGDVWRTARIAGESKKYHASFKTSSKIPKSQWLKLSGLSVLADRTHGFWSLSILGLSSFIIFFLFKSIGYLEDNQVIDYHTDYVTFYLIALLTTILLPMLIGLFIFLYKKKIDEHHLNKRNFFLDIANLWLAGKEKVTNFISLTSQGFFGLAFWICLHSVGIEINIFLILFVTPGIFLIGSLPIAIAGFGPREAGSILFLLPFSVNNENIFVSSILFGLASTIIGAITLLINLLLQSKKR